MDSPTGIWVILRIRFSIKCISYYNETRFSEQFLNLLYFLVYGSYRKLIKTTAHVIWDGKVTSQISIQPTSFCNFEHCLGRIKTSHIKTVFTIITKFFSESDSLNNSYQWLSPLTEMLFLLSFHMKFFMLNLIHTSGGVHRPSVSNH